MKYFVVALVVLCGLQMAQAINLRKCVDTALEAAERSAGKVEGFQQWRENYLQAVNDFEDTRRQCMRLENPLQITRCQIDSFLKFRDEVVALGQQLTDLAGGSVQIGQDFVDGLLECLRIRN